VNPVVETLLVATVLIMAIHRKKLDTSLRLTVHLLDEGRWFVLPPLVVGLLGLALAAWALGYPRVEPFRYLNPASPMSRPR